MFAAVLEQVLEEIGVVEYVTVPRIAFHAFRNYAEVFWDIKVIGAKSDTSTLLKLVGLVDSPEVTYAIANFAITLVSPEFNLLSNEPPPHPPNISLWRISLLSPTTSPKMIEDNFYFYSQWAMIIVIGQPKYGRPEALILGSSEITAGIRKLNELTEKGKAGSPRGVQNVYWRCRL